jgi:hypothetical protein
MYSIEKIISLRLTTDYQIIYADKGLMLNCIQFMLFTCSEVALQAKQLYLESEDLAYKLFAFSFQHEELFLQNRSEIDEMISQMNKIGNESLLEKLQGAGNSIRLRLNVDYIYAHATIFRKLPKDFVIQTKTNTLRTSSFLISLFCKIDMQKRELDLKPYILSQEDENHMLCALNLLKDVQKPKGDEWVSVCKLANMLDAYMLHELMLEGKYFITSHLHHTIVYRDFFWLIVKPFHNSALPETFRRELFTWLYEAHFNFYLANQLIEKKILEFFNDASDLLPPLFLATNLIQYLKDIPFELRKVFKLIQNEDMTYNLSTLCNLLNKEDQGMEWIFQLINTYPNLTLSDIELKCINKGLTLTFPIGHDIFSAQLSKYLTTVQNLTLVVSSDTFKGMCFEGISSLKEIKLPFYVLKIQAYQFQNCESLQYVYGLEDVIIFGDFSFHNCKKLKGFSFSQNIEQIGNGSFINCNQIKRLSFGKELKQLGKESFMNCQKLEEIDLSQCQLLEKLEERCFANCSNLKIIRLNANLKIIENYAFHKCESLFNLRITSKDILIKNYAFNECIAFKEIYYPSDANIACEKEAFHGCKIN